MKAALLAVSAIAALAFAAQQPPDPVIEAARNAAVSYQQSLPDYIVKRTTIRYKGNRLDLKASAGAVDIWHTVDTVSGDVAAQHGKEVYSNIVLNGKPAKELPSRGAWSAGEFATALMAILPPERAAVFTHQRGGNNSVVTRRSATTAVVDESHLRRHPRRR